MFNTLFRMVRRANYPTGFQAYLNKVQTNDHGVGPTVQEARRDYQRMPSRSQDLLG